MADSLGCSCFVKKDPFRAHALFANECPKFCHVSQSICSQSRGYG
jgi:hypothetical protein